MSARPSSKLFLVFLVCSVILFLTLLWAYFSAVLLGLLIGTVFYPISSWLRRISRVGENTSALLVTVLIFLILVVPVSWFVSTLSKEAFEFYDRTRTAVSITQLEDLLNANPALERRIRKIGETFGFEFTPEHIEILAKSIGKKVGFFLYKQISSAASNLLSFLIHFFLMMLIIYYILRDGNKLKYYLIELLPLPRPQLEKIGEKFQEMGRAVLLGNGLSGVVQGICGGVGFFIFGLSSPFLWGTVIAFMAFLPIIGASVVFLPATFILIIEKKFGMALGFLIYNLSYSLSVEYFAKPKIIGKGMEMNPLLVFIGIIGGIKVFGILGIIYGPLIITIFLTLAEIYRLEYKENLC